MAINPNIALMGQNIDLATPLQDLYDRKRQKKQDAAAEEEKQFQRGRLATMDARYEDEKQFERGRLGRQDARQAKIDEKNARLSDLQISQIQKKIQEDDKDASFRDYARDAIKIKSMIDAGDTEGAMEYGRQRVARLENAKAAGANVNSNDTQRFLDVLSVDPTQAVKMLDGELDYLQQIGYVPKPDKRELITLGEGEQAYDTSGNLVASGAPKQEKPPAGYRFSDDGRSLEPIPGSPEAVKAAEAQNKIKMTLDNAKSKAEIITSKVDEALELISKDAKGGILDPLGVVSSTGATGQALRNLGGTKALALEKSVDTIKANLGFEELQKMREASPTGGALGAVTERELAFLQNTLASLDTAQDTETIVRNLKEVKTHYKNWLEAVNQSQAPQEGGQGSIQEGATATNPQTGEKVMFRGGQWVNQ